MAAVLKIVTLLLGVLRRLMFKYSDVLERPGFSFQSD